MNLHTGPDTQRSLPRAKADETTLRLENISVRYHVPHERYATLKEHAIRWLERRVHYDDFWALCDLDLETRRGEVVGIIGRNGAGKSTLLKVVARVLHPTRGRVWMRGRVAPLLEFGAGFHPELSGRENVFLNGALLGFSHAAMQTKFKRIVDFAEMWDFIDAPLRTYSSGMVTRLGFAVASDVDPDILIVDEALGVGDAAFQSKSYERIQGFRAAGATILLVSHNMDVVRAMCDRAVWLDRGRVVAQGSPADVVYQYLSHDARLEGSRLAGAAVPSTDHRWGSRRIEITNVRLMNPQGQPQTIFQTGESLVLEIGYISHDSIVAPIFGMAIHRQDGVHVTGPNTDFAGLTLPTLIGGGKLTYTIRNLPLLEGLYHISVAVTNHTDTEIFDYHDRVYPFRVINKSECIRERYGVVTLNGEWKHAVVPVSSES